MKHVFEAIEPRPEAQTKMLGNILKAGTNNNAKPKRTLRFMPLAAAATALALFIGGGVYLFGAGNGSGIEPLAPVFDQQTFEGYYREYHEFFADHIRETNEAHRGTAGWNRDDFDTEEEMQAAIDEFTTALNDNFDKALRAWLGNNPEFEEWLEFVRWLREDYEFDGEGNELGELIRAQEKALNELMAASTKSMDEKMLAYYAEVRENFGCDQAYFEALISGEIDMYVCLEEYDESLFAMIFEHDKALNDWLNDNPVYRDWLKEQMNGE